MQQTLLTNTNIATMIPGGDAYGMIIDGAIAMSNGQIQWVGKLAECPQVHADWKQRNLEGRLVTPALIDCHTHVVFGGNRALEFEMRLNGASYEEVAKAGGGIVSTVRATRELNEGQLLQEALVRVDAMIAEGVASLEIKSGYGLDQETELRILRVARRIGEERDVRVSTSFLGAHAVPAEYIANPDKYIDEVCIPTLIEAHNVGLVDTVDGFCEGIGFSPNQISRVFDKAMELGIPVKLHAEQLSNLGGAKLAANYGALSADHLEYLDEDGVKAMAEAETVAVLLPGAFYTLRETKMPPVDLLRQHGVSIAIGTDCNPGSSPLTSLLLTMNMACTFFHMTPEEALAGATSNAAKALGLNDCGEIAVGKRADLAIWDVKHPSELSYRIGFNPLFERIVGGSS